MLAIVLAFGEKPTSEDQQKANKGDKMIKLSDGGGLQLWIMPIGSELWQPAYRDSQGKQKKLAFWAYPTVGLADARKKRDEARAL